MSGGGGVDVLMPRVVVVVVAPFVSVKEEEGFALNLFRRVVF